MDQEAASSHPAEASPPESPEQPHAGYRSVIASSINLVQSYRRSQLFIGDNLPNSFSESSFNANYLSSRQHRGVHDGAESDNDDDGRSYATSFSDRDGEIERAEGDEEYSDDEDTDRDLPSSFLPPNAFGSRRLPASRCSRASQASFPRQWTRQTSGSARSRLPNQEGDLPGGPHSPRSTQFNRTLERTPTAESSQLITPQLSFPRYGSLNGESSGRRFSTARSSFRHRERPDSEAGSAAESQDPRQPTPSHCSSTSRADFRHPPALGTSTFGQTLFNAFNILCGVGLLSEPLAFSAMGWVGGVLLFIFCGLSTNYTAKILARLMAEDRFLLTYNDICYKAFGRSMQYPIAGLFCLELFALSVALMVIFGDSLATIFPDISADSFKILAFCLVLPTVFMPLPLLSYTSLIGLVSSLTLVGVVVFDGLVKEEAPGSIFHPAKTSLSPSHRWGLSAGLMMSGFSGHSVMPSLAREMRNPQDFNRMVDYAYVAAGSMYLIVGLIGYLMFGDDVSQEITQDLLRTPGFPTAINHFGIWMVGINPVAKFALCTRPLNVTIEHLLNLTSMDDMSDPHAPAIQKRSTPVPTSQALPKNAVSSHPNQLTPRSTHSDLRGSYHEAASGSAGKNKPAMFTKALGRTISRTVVTSLVVIVSILLPNFERVMGFLGAFAAFVICTILPVSAEMIMTRGQGRSPTTKIINIVLLVVSVVMAAIGTTYSFLPA
ncbi:uncharacterized protein PGTG_16456 [Puccinia graminis f. sp. tritici CRL 75-36-700-3]|uniref:Amino acid transporter transmembrane domain-containing protein n=1 Tax=Puccinia graminis f. sp. tritici (strain CRL 75-36-700-3 / race SCCL) TaxID=418459 RepID=E3L0V3_PUCGT|nr:uncharacterized protein PGTG_16456 [Puccinia graminis f. sp. tritici CRL 75-36-700-3]EFP90178.2 hypothetical protein PGTG_16456 [Puccinia graminis f. sp. tritici CRL 75-36-700-3]